MTQQTTVEAQEPAAQDRPAEPGPGWFARHTVFTTAALAFLVLVGIDLATGGGSRDRIQQRGDSDAVDLAAAAPRPVPGDGTYEIGREIAAGTYTSTVAGTGSSPYCSVATSPRDREVLPQRRAVDSTERMTITLSRADGTITVKGCGPLTPVR